MEETNKDTSREESVERSVSMENQDENIMEIDQSVAPVIEQTPQIETVESPSLVEDQPQLVEENQPAGEAEEEEQPVVNQLLEQEHPIQSLSDYIVEPTVEVNNNELTAVSAFYGISLELLNANPQLVQSLSSKLSDIESLKTDNEILSLNYESLQHQSKKKVESVIEQLKITQNSVNELKLKNAEFDKIKKELEDSLISANNNKNTDNKIVIELKNKLESLNIQNQSNSQLMESKQQEVVNLTEEIKTIADDNKQLRKKMMEIETSLEVTKSESWTAKSDISRYEREIKSIKETSNWFESELKSKVSQLEKLKGDNENKVVVLESKLHQLNHDYKVAKTTSDNYSKSLSELSIKNEKNSFDLKELTDKLTIQESQFMEKLNKRDELIHVLETSNRDKASRIESLDNLFKETLDKVKQDENEYQKVNDKLFKELAEKELKVEELEKMVDTLNNSATLDHSGEHISLNASSQRTLKELNTYSLTDLIGEINSLRKEVIKEKRAKFKAEEELETVFKELDQRMPVLQSYKDKCDDYEEKQHKMTVILDSLTKENSSSNKKLIMSNKRVNEIQSQCNTLNKYKVDLQRQVVVLLSELQFKCNGDMPLTNDEKHYITSIVSSYGEINDIDSTDTDSLISSRLATFRDIIELVKQNEQLLTVSRKLGEELESKNSNEELDNIENETIQKAKSAILKLQTQLKNTETQLEAVSHSKDVLQDMLDSQGTTANKSDIEALNERVANLINELKHKREELESLRTKYDSKIVSLNEMVQQLVSDKSEVSLQWNKEKSNNTLLQEKVNHSESLVKNLNDEKFQILESNSKLQERLRYFEDKLLASNSSLVKNNTSMAELEITVKGLSVEKDILKTTEIQLRKDIEKLHQEKIESNSLIIKLETVNSERQSHFRETLQRYVNNVEVCQKEIDQLRFKLDSSYNETHSILHSKNADSKAYQNRIDLLQSQLGSLNETLNSKTKQVNELTTRVEDLTKRFGDIGDKKQSRLNAITSSSGTTDEITTLKAELADAIEDLDLVNRDATQYKELSIATEKQLSSLNEVFDQYKTSSEVKIADLTKEVVTLTSKVKELETERDLFKTQFENLQYDSNIQIQESKLKITELNSTIEGFEATKKDYEEKIEIIKKDSDFNNEKVEQLQVELASKEEQLNNLESAKMSSETQLDIVNQTLATVTNELADNKSYHETELSKWKSERKRYEEEARSFKIRVSELDTQNRTLINQFEESPLNLNDSSDMKTLVTYLTRERDSLNQQLEYAKNEEKVLRQEVSNKDQELSLLQGELANAKERVKVLDKYSEKLEDLKSEVSEMAVYKDNNNQLRDQITNLETTIAELKSQLVSSITPLQRKNDELENEISKRDQILSMANSEVEKMKSQINALESNKGDSVKELSSKIKELDELNNKFEKMKNLSRERYKKLKDENTILISDKSKLDEKIKELSAIGDSGEELSKLKVQMRSLKNQLHEKEVEKGDLVTKHKEEVLKLTQELENVKSETLSGDLRGEFEKEKADALKQLEIKLQSQSPASFINEDELRTKLGNEWKEKLAVEIEAAKAQQLSKASKILERRKQEYKIKEKEYEDKISSLENKLKTSGDANNSDLISKFELEKAEYIKQCNEEKEKILREKKLKETLMQKKVDVYEKKLKELDGTLPPPSTANSTNGATVIRPNPAATSFGMPVFSSPAPVASAFNFNAAAKGSPAFKFNPSGSIPTQPAKRSNESEGSEDSKRSKIE